MNLPIFITRIRDLLFLPLIVGLTYISSASAEQWTVVALENPPYSYEKNRVACGSAVQRVQIAVEALGKQPRISIVPWKRALAMVRSGEAHLALNASRNAEREKYAYFIQKPLIEEVYVLYKRIEDSLPDQTNQLNTQGLRFGVQRGYNYPPELQGFLSQARKEILDSIPQALEMLIAGRIDLFIGDAGPVDYWLNQAGLAEKITPLTSTETARPVVLGRQPTYLVLSKQAVTRAEFEALNDVLNSPATKDSRRATLDRQTNTATRNCTQD